MANQRVYFGGNKSFNKISALPEDASITDKIISALRTVYDPEIPVNLYDLGLIYQIEIRDSNSVFIRMTLTAPACPIAGSLVKQVECAVREVDQVQSVDVELVWEPPWSKEFMSDEARLELGLF